MERVRTLSMACKGLRTLVTHHVAHVLQVPLENLVMLVTHWKQIAPLETLKPRHEAPWHQRPRASLADLFEDCSVTARAKLSPSSVRVPATNDTKCVVQANKSAILALIPQRCVQTRRESRQSYRSGKAFACLVGFAAASSRMDAGTLQPAYRECETSAQLDPLPILNAERLYSQPPFARPWVGSLTRGDHASSALKQERLLEGPSSCSMIPQWYARVFRGCSVHERLNSELFGLFYGPSFMDTSAVRLRLTTVVTLKTPWLPTLGSSPS
eukprot:842075-Prorocentrum_minimum.AAC.3